MQKAFSYLFHSLVLVSACLLFHCAGELPPGGGPVDTVPPKIIATYPEPNTVNFSDSKITLGFDEYVEEASLEQSVFVSPFLGLLEFDWSGKQVEIRFSERLRPATTYVVTVGTDVVDLRNRNRMERAFSLAFSTGASIDSGAIAGLVFDEKPEGVMIFAYQIDSLAGRNLNPSTENPHYITQTGKGGTFSLTHLSFGSYRVFAIRDEYKNLLYDVGIDELGMPHGDVRIDNVKPSVEEISFQLTKEDTTRPQLYAASAFDQRHVLLRFSKPLDPDRFSPASIVIVDSINGGYLTAGGGFVDLQILSSLVVLTSEQKASVGYRITVDSIFDANGNLLDPRANSAVFSGANIPDTSAPQIVYASVRDSVREIPLDAQLEIRFDDVVQRENIERSFSLLDSSGLTIDGIFSWKTSAAFTFTPARELRSKEWYRLRLPLSAVADLQENHGKDSLFVRRFETIDKNQLGSLDGEVVDETVDKRKAPFVIKAREVGEKRRGPYEVRLPAPGKFQIPHIAEGSYVLSAYRDDDNNGKYSYGRPFPYEPAELFSFYPDTVKIRARWPVQGVVVRLR